jgi:hypothetical protein
VINSLSESLIEISIIEKALATDCLVSFVVNDGTIYE